jgi:hypothetical protein
MREPLLFLERFIRPPLAAPPHDDRANQRALDQQGRDDDRRNGAQGSYEAI